MDGNTNNDITGVNGNNTSTETYDNTGIHKTDNTNINNNTNTERQNKDFEIDADFKSFQVLHSQISKALSSMWTWAKMYL